MKARYALLLAMLALPACGSIRKDRPLSRIDRDRGPLILDGPDRVRFQRRHQEDPGLVARALPWKWFD